MSLEPSEVRGTKGPISTNNDEVSSKSNTGESDVDNDEIENMNNSQKLDELLRKMRKIDKVCKDMKGVKSQIKDINKKVDGIIPVEQNVVKLETEVQEAKQS